MPVSTLQLHVAAVQALLVPPTVPTGVTLYDGDVPSTPGQTYIVLYPDAGATDRSTIRAVSDLFDMLLQATCVGTSARQARDVLGFARAALVDQVPAIAGRTCWPITEEPGTPPMQRIDKTRDPAIDQPRFYFTPQFRVRSTV